MFLSAGYVSQAVFDLVRTRPTNNVDWMKVLEQLSSFDVDGLPDSDASPTSVIAVASDLVSRGAPTLCSLRVERELERILGLTRTPGEDSGAAGLRTTFASPLSGEQTTALFRSMLPVCHNLTLDEIESALPTSAQGRAFDSNAEREFFRGPLQNALGAEVLQFIQTQRQLESILRGAKSQFSKQRVDFALEWVGGQHSGGIIYEVDGPQHQDPDQRKLDADRDTELKNLSPSWRTYRRKLWSSSATDPIDQAGGMQKALWSSSVFKLLQHPLDRNEHSKDAAWRVLINGPIAVARIQKTVLEAVRTGLLRADANQWNIIVIDRDGIGDVLLSALPDLTDLVRAVADIHGADARMPEVSTCCLTPQPDGSLLAVDVSTADLVLDVSIGLKRRQRTAVPGLKGHSGRTLVIRSLWGEAATEGYVSLSSDMTRHEITEEGKDRRVRGYVYILQNVFRKSSFREKQIDVIERVMQGRSVIALLPTGAGKSLTYQLPALVSCGAVVVVDPIRSLMKDQVDSLTWMGIGCTGWMNSWLTTEQRRKTAERFKSGATKILFISPERMQISEFRVDLTEFSSAHKRRFAFAVIDEAHCVSEWGHDFRTAYLRLGENLKTYLRGYEGEIPLVALTGTASFEVLDDVKVELGLAGRNDVDVRPESMQRTNLSYRVLPSEVKDKELLSTLDTITNNGSIDTFLQSEAGCGLVFAPHKTGKLGTSTALASVRMAVGQDLESAVDQFHGGGNDSQMMKVMDDFKTGRVRLLCCTKAFGMGIDKPDIRFTLHVNEPQSLESFYQEAGRAGRDGLLSNCWILWSSNADKEVCMNFINSSFRSPGFDYQKVLEILDKNQNYADQLTRMSMEIYNQFGYDLTLRPWSPPGKPALARLYVNEASGEFLLSDKIWIDLANAAITAKGVCKEPAVLDYLVARIVVISNGERGEALVDLLTSPCSDIQSLTPLRTKLEELPYGESTSARIALDNGLLSKLARTWELDEAAVRNAYQYSSGPKGFASKVLDMNELMVADERPSEYDLAAVFTEARTDADTYRAVYRLSVLGLLEDYTVDYRASVIEAKVRSLTRQDIRERVQTYIARYAPLSLGGYLSRIDLEPSIDECLHLLIKFVYDRIKVQREEALRIMDQTAAKGVDDPSAFEDAIVQYFDSSLLPVLRELRVNYSFDSIRGIIVDTDNASSQLAHLLGAANRLLPEVPDNAAYHFLRSYALEGMMYPEPDVRQELEEAIRLFLRQGWTQGEVAALCGFAGQVLSATQVRPPSAFLEYYYSFHRERLGAISSLAS